MGGPMMGIAVADPDMPVVKNNNAILAFSPAASVIQQNNGLHPVWKMRARLSVGLMPAGLERAYDNRNLPMLRKMKVNLCINCGCCSYVCPAKRDLAAKNQLAKQIIREKH